ncbi:MAG: lysozyme [Cyanothece sp. SIO1E1]|nr:lysozyme [Cyanothece sp. SIO1E1]
MSEGSHIKISLGKDNKGNQVHFRGRNTWYVYAPAVTILRNDQPITSTTPISGGKTNANGLRLIKSFEGLRLTAYADAVGVWTIGYGTTSGVRPGMTITRAQAEEFLRRDLRRFEAAITKNVKVRLNEDQFAALASFTYNVGEGAMASSTLVRLLNNGDIRGAADQFPRWNKAGGRVLAGLTRRRRAERALFLGEDFTAFL